MTAKDLKNALLQEAVQGKLVPQIASEGNARDLLKEIRKERGESLPLAPARKRSSATPSAGSNAARNARFAPITEDEIPFEIPEKWCWCRITDIATCELGKTKDALKNKGVMKDYLCSINIQEEGIDLSKVKQMKFEESEFERYTVKKNDLLICEGGDAGRCAIYDNDEPMYYQNALHRIRFFYNLNPKFYLYVFQVYKANKILSEASKGVTIQHLTGTALKELYFPLPPLAEQKRIVAAIEKFMPLIEEYGKKETEFKAFNEQIGALTKKAILQEAVQGKLVPQIAAEGNAKDLLEEIRKERLSHGFDFANAKSGKRRLKKETVLAGSNRCDIKEDEIPFDIPESWCWCRLGEIVPFGVCQNADPQEINDEDWILDLEDIEKDSGKILSFKTKKEVDSKSTKHIFKKGFVLYSKLRPYLNKCVIAPKDGFCTSEILPLDFGDMIYNKYAQLYLMSPFFVDYTNSLSFGVKMPRLGTENGRKALFPLPPLAEQKRIVAAIEKMLPLCEKLGE